MAREIPVALRFEWTDQMVAPVSTVVREGEIVPAKLVAWPSGSVGNQRYGWYVPYETGDTQ